MPVVPITQIDDRRLEPYRNLKFTSGMRRDGLFVAEGDKLTARLLRSRFQVHSVLAGEQFIASGNQEFPSDLTIFVAPDSLLRDIVGFKFHRGVLACGIRGRGESLATVIDAAISGTTDGASNQAHSNCTLVVVVVCVDIQDPTNLGTILRTAQAFRANAVIFAGDCADPLSRRVLRVSMGASLDLPIVQSNELASDLDALRKRFGMSLIAAVADASGRPLEALTRSNRMAVLFGNESAGLAEQWVEICDQRVTIPMNPRADSLNVAVATGIFLYHLCRQPN